MDNLPEFFAALDRIDAAVPEAIHQVHIQGAEAAYAEANRATPVDTRALQLENLVLVNGRIVYEAPNRIGPDAPRPVGTILEPPPSPGDARRALEGADRLGFIEILNQRFYAEEVHNRAPWTEAGAAAFELFVRAHGDRILKEHLRERA